MPETEHLDVVILGSGQGGKLLAWHLGRSGKKVKSRKQAIAIGLNEARKKGAKVPRKKKKKRCPRSPSAAPPSWAHRTSRRKLRFAIQQRGVTLDRQQVLPRARETLELAQAAYRSSRVDFLSVIDAERSLLNFQLDEISAQTDREIARGELVLLIAGLPAWLRVFFFAAEVEIATSQGNAEHCRHAEGGQPLDAKRRAKFHIDGFPKLTHKTPNRHDIFP